MSASWRFPRQFRLPWRSRDQIREEVDAEIAFHLDMQAEELIASGVDPARAREHAQRQFGDIEQAAESLRRADESLEARRRRTEWFSGLATDLRFVARSLRRSKGATGAVVLTLGLGIGVVTTVFSFVNWIALRPVAGVTDPDRLVVVRMWDEVDEEVGLSYQNLMDLNRATPALRAVMGYATTGLQAVVEGEPPVPLIGEAVAGDYFGTLGLRPVTGRFLTKEEQGPGAPSYQAVISHRLWRTSFAGDPYVAGRLLRLNGIDFTVIGVGPEGFQGTERLGTTDVWVPLSSYSALAHQEGLNVFDRRGEDLEEIIGRLAPDATPAIAQEQLRSAMSRLAEAYPDENEVYATYIPSVYPGIGLEVMARDHVARTLSLMLAAAAVVLLIAWANVGNLLLFRGMQRRGENAVRKALGSSSGRLLRTHLVEGLFLALAGGAIGTVVALWATGLFQGTSMGWLPAVERVGLDWRVLAFVLILSLLSGVLFGVIPVWAIKAENFLAHLREASRTSTGRVTWLRGGLIIAQISSAMVLVVTALLLAQTLQALNRVDVGFDTEGIFAFGMDPSDLGYDAARNRAFRAQLAERLAGTPGIESASLTAGSPFGGSYMVLRLRSSAAADAPFVDAQEFATSPELFRTLGIPLLSGVGLTTSGSTDEVVISRSLARQLFGNTSALGRTIVGPEINGTTPASFTVVGVAGDTRVQALRGPEPDPVIYRPISGVQPWRSFTTVLVRSSWPQSEVAAAIHAIVAGIEPSLAIWQTEAMSASVANTISEERLLARLAMLLAILAAALAAVGLYAVVCSAVAQQTREIGIRMAIGARFGEIVRMVSRHATPAVAAGIGLGTLVAIAGSTALESWLFGVERLNPLFYGVAAGLLVLAATIALWGPIRTAGGVDPATALRQE